VISALTGETVAKVEDYLTEVMGVDLDWAGASAADLIWAFHRFGRAMDCVAAFEQAFSGPPLGGWLASLSPEWRREHPLAVAVEDEVAVPHWVAVWGRSVCDSLSYGRWRPLASSQLGGRFVSHAWTIDPPPRMAGPVEMG
jgi:hypothetical protein